MPDIKIKVKGTQYSEDNIPLVTELFSEGSFYVESKDFCFEYCESEITGINGSISKLITDGNKKVTLIRDGGPDATIMIFEEGKNLSSNYFTEYGSFNISINTIKVKCDFNDKGIGNIYLEYILAFGANNKSMNKLEITTN